MSTLEPEISETELTIVDATGNIIYPKCIEVSGNTHLTIDDSKRGKLSKFFIIKSAWIKKEGYTSPTEMREYYKERRRKRSTKDPAPAPADEDLRSLAAAFARAFVLLQPLVDLMVFCDRPFRGYAAMEHHHQIAIPFARANVQLRMLCRLYTTSQAPPLASRPLLTCRRSKRWRVLSARSGRRCGPRGIMRRRVARRGRRGCRRGPRSSVRGRQPYRWAMPRSKPPRLQAPATTR